MRIKRHFSIVPHSPDTVELRYGVWNPSTITLTDESGSGYLLRILNRLDGSHSVEEIASAEDLPVSVIESVVEKLASANALESSATHALDHYLDQITPYMRTHEAKPNSAPRRVLLIGDDEATNQISSILRESNLRQEYTVRTADPLLRRLLLECGTSWLSDQLAFEEGVQAFPSDSWLVADTAELKRRIGRIEDAHRLAQLGLRVARDEAVRSRFVNLANETKPGK